MSQIVKRFGALNYGRCELLMRDNGRVSIGPNTTLHYDIEGDHRTYRVKFHDTYIITFYVDGRIILNTGGYKSTTTKQRMNALLGDWSVYQRNHEWRVTCRNEEGFIDEQYFDGINVGIRDSHKSMVHAAYFGDKLAKKMVHDIHEEGKE